MLVTTAQAVQYRDQYEGTRVRTCPSVRVITLQSAAQAVTIKPSAVNAAHYQRSIEEARGQDWLGAPDVHVARQRTLEGWPEGWDRMRENLSTLAIPVLPKRRRTRFSDDGPDLNLDRYLDGADLCWNVRKRVPIPTVDITVDIGGNAHLESEALVWRGAACVAMSDALERAGYRVRLTAVDFGLRRWVGQDEDKGCITRVVLKQFNEPLRPGHLAGAICTATLFRVGFFSAWLAQPEETNYALGTNRMLADARFTAPLHFGYKVQDARTAQAVLTKLANTNLDRVHRTVHA